MEEALHDTEAFVLRRELARATDVRRRNATAAAAAARLGAMEEVAPAGPAAAAAAAAEAEPAVGREEVQNRHNPCFCGVTDNLVFMFVPSTYYRVGEDRFRFCGFKTQVRCGAVLYQPV